MAKQKDIVVVLDSNGTINIHKDADRYRVPHDSPNLILQNGEGEERARYHTYSAVRLVSVKDKDFFPDQPQRKPRPQPVEDVGEDTGEAQPA